MPNQNENVLQVGLVPGIGSKKSRNDRIFWFALLSFLLLVVAELTAFAYTFHVPLIPLRERHDVGLLWGYVGLFPKYCALISAGVAVLGASRISEYRLLLASHHASRMLFLLHVTSAAILVGVTAWVALGGDPASAMAMVLLAICLLVALSAWVISTLSILLPNVIWTALWREQKWTLLFVMACTVAYKPIAIAFPGIEGWIAERLFPSTVYVASILNGWLGYEAVIDVASRAYRVGTFEVLIGDPCLGYQGVGMTLLFLSAHIYTARGTLRFPNVLVVIPVALVSIWLLNAFRIGLLMVIGSSWSSEIAVDGFHSAAGWLYLIAVLLASVLIINKFAFFSKAPATKARRLDDEEILLVPQLVLLATALVTLLFTASFDWLYPVRVMVVGAVLLYYRKRFGLGSFRLNPVAVAIGFGVFLMWIVLVPPSPEKSAVFATALFSAPGWIAMGWLLMRLIGAVIVVPFAEELAFRGFLLPRLQAVFAGVSLPARQFGATLISSAAFGALHGSWLAGTLAGIGFAAARYHRGNLLDAICAHLTANLILGLYVLATRQWSYW